MSMFESSVSEGDQAGAGPAAGAGAGAGVVPAISANPGEAGRDPLEHPLVRFGPSGIEGMGGYARVPIAEGTEIIEYVGEKISKEESLRRCELNNPFIFGLDEDHDLDGNVPWNPARFLNHSCAPNCEALEDEGRIWISALRDIAEGEELTFNYGYSLEEYRDNPCQCRAPGCVGFMVAEDHFEAVRNNAAWRAAGEGAAIVPSVGAPPGTAG